MGSAGAAHFFQKGGREFGFGRRMRGLFVFADAFFAPWAIRKGNELAGQD